MWVPQTIKPGETDASKKKILFEVFTSAGLYATGGADAEWEGAAPVFAAGDLKLSWDLGVTWTNVIGAAPAMQGKSVKYVFDNAEVAAAHLPAISIGVKFAKAGFRDQEFYIPFRAEIESASYDTDAISAAAVSAAAVTKIQAGLATSAQVQNIAVTGAALNAVASAVVVTTGTPGGTLANTHTLDAVRYSIAHVAGVIDAYFEWDVSATAGAVGVGVQLDGYFDDPANGADLTVEAFDWGGAVWEQVGTILADPIPTQIPMPFDLTNSHTDAATKKVRLRVHGVGLGGTLRVDRILLGYAVVLTPDMIADEVQTRTNGANVLEWLNVVPDVLDLDGNVPANTKVLGTETIDYDIFTERCWRALARSPYHGDFLVDAGQPITQTAMRLPLGLTPINNGIRNTILLVTLNTGVGWWARVKTYDIATGDTTLWGTGFPGLLDATSNVRLLITDETFDVPVNANIGAVDDGAIKDTSFSDDARKRLFREIYHGTVLTTADGQAVLSTGLFVAGQLRGNVLHVYKGTGAGESWEIGYNDGASGRTLALVGGDSWPQPPINEGGDGPSSVIIFAFADSIGTAFNQGGAELTSGRQQLKGIAGTHLHTAGVNIGQKDKNNPAIFKDEAGGDLATIDVDKTTAAKTSTWVKGPL